MHAALAAIINPRSSSAPLLTYETLTMSTTEIIITHKDLVYASVPRYLLPLLVPLLLHIINKTKTKQKKPL